MMTPHIPRPTGPHYGYGLDVESSPHGFTIVHHWGSAKGVASHVGVIPERGLTAETLSNLSDFGSEGVGLMALEPAAGLPPGAFSRN